MYGLILGLILAIGLAFAGVSYARAAQDIETPAYTIEKRVGDFEVRQYPALVVAQFNADGSRRTAVRQAFSPLARYIFAKDREGEKIAMTAPVMQEPSNAGWTVSFIMPKDRTLADLPAPTGAVTLAQQAPRRMAVVRFSGVWTDRKFQEAERRLRQWIVSEGLRPVGAAEFGYYNDPFTLPAWRRNEVLIEIEP